MAIVSPKSGSSKKIVRVGAKIRAVFALGGSFSHIILVSSPFLPFFSQKSAPSARTTPHLLSPHNTSAPRPKTGGRLQNVYPRALPHPRKVSQPIPGNETGLRHLT